MPIFKITDPKTGRSIRVEGAVPPAPADIDRLFAQAPAAVPPPQQTTQSQTAPPPAMNKPLALLNETLTGFNRSVAGVADFAMSPYRAYKELTGDPVPTLESLVPRKGVYAGEGLGTNIASTTGELLPMAMTIPVAARYAVTNLLDDAARYGESAWRGILRQVGGSTPVDDVLATFTSAVGAQTAGTVAAKVGGEEYRKTGEMVGGVFLPMSLAPVLNRLTRLVEPLVREAAPTVTELKGASRVLYKQVEDLGIIYSEQATQRIAKDLEDIAVSESLTNFRGETALATQYTKIRNVLTQPGEFNGTTFSVLDKARAAFKDVGAGTDNEARIARMMSEKIDDWLLSTSADDVAGFSNYSGAQQALPGPASFSALPVAEKDSVRVTLSTARSLWRRAKAGELVEGTIKDATLASLGGQGQPFEKVVVENLRNLLRNEKTALTFSKEERAQIAETIKGGGLRNQLELLTKVGVKSADLIKGTLMGLTGAALFSPAPLNAAAVGAGGLLAGGAVLSKAAQTIATRILKTDVHTLDAFIKAGPNAQEITRIYMSRVPIKDRKAAELSALFKVNGADLSKLAALPMAKSPIISDAIAFAQAWSQAEAEEAAQTKQ